MVMLHTWRGGVSEEMSSWVCSICQGFLQVDAPLGILIWVIRSIHMNIQSKSLGEIHDQQNNCTNNNKEYMSYIKEGLGLVKEGLVFLIVS